MNTNKRVTGLLKAIVSEHFAEEAEAFEVAGDEYVAMALAGENPDSLKKRAAVNNEFGESVVPMMKFVVLTWQTVKVILDIYGLLTAEAEVDGKKVAERWRDELRAAGLDPLTAENIAKEHASELEKIIAEKRNRS